MAEQMVKVQSKRLISSMTLLYVSGTLSVLSRMRSGQMTIVSVFVTFQALLKMLTSKSLLVCEILNPTTEA